MKAPSGPQGPLAPGVITTRTTSTSTWLDLSIQDVATVENFYAGLFSRGFELTPHRVDAAGIIPRDANG